MLSHHILMNMLSMNYNNCDDNNNNSYNCNYNNNL